MKTTKALWVGNFFAYWDQSNWSQPDPHRGTVEQNHELPKPHLVLRKDRLTERDGYVDVPVNQITPPCQ